MDKFINFLLNLMNKASIIAPHLQAILQSIIRPHNSHILSEDQWALLEIDLLAFFKKLERLGIVFEPNQPKTEFKKENMLRLCELGLKGINELNDRISKLVYKPAFENCMMGKNIEAPSKTKLWIDRCMDEIAPSLAVNAPIPDFVSSFNHVEECVFRLVDDALLALSRVNPMRLISVAGSLFVRDVGDFSIFLSEVEFKNLKTSHYSVEELSMPGYSYYTFTPKSHMFDSVIAKNIYDTNIEDLTIGGLLTKGSVVSYDKNFGVVPMFNKLMGTAVSSLDLVLELYCLVGGRVAEIDNKGTGIMVFREQFKSEGLQDIMHLCSPSDLSTALKKDLSIGALTRIHKTVMENIVFMKRAIFVFGLYRDEIDCLFSNPSEKQRTNDDFYHYGGYSEPKAPSRDTSFILN